jgi:hypothetical protein
MASCLDQVALLAGSRILAGKGYYSAKNDQLFQRRGLLIGIQRKQE